MTEDQFGDYSYRDLAITIEPRGPVYAFTVNDPETLDEVATGTAPTFEQAQDMAREAADIWAEEH